MSNMWIGIVMNRRDRAGSLISKGATPYSIMGEEIKGFWKLHANGQKLTAAPLQASQAPPDHSPPKQKLEARETL